MGGDDLGLLTEKDLSALQKAMDRLQEITLTRQDREQSVTVSTALTGKSKAWDVPVIVQLRVRRGNMETVQNFESIKELRNGAG